MSPDDFRRLVAAGLSNEQIAIVMEMFDEREEVRKASQRARWRKHQENKKNANVSQREQTLANVPRGGVTRVEDKTSNSEIEPQEENKKRERALASFDEFWSVYPNKTGKPVAQKSYLKAIRTTEPSVILDGLRRYIASKPADRPWLNPSTFLNQERWADQPANVVPLARGSPGLSMNDFLGTVIDQQERRNAAADTEIEGYPPPARFVR